MPQLPQFSEIKLDFAFFSVILSVSKDVGINEV